LRRHEAFGNLCRDVAEILDALAGARSTLEREAVAQAGADVHVDAVPVLILLAVAAGRLHLVVDLAEERRVDVVEPGDRVAASARQARVLRSGEAVGGPVARLHSEVAGDVLPVPPAFVVLTFVRDARLQPFSAGAVWRHQLALGDVPQLRNGW